MFINLARLKKEPLKTIKYSFKGKIEPGWLSPEEQAGDRNEIEINAEAYYNESIIFLAGKMHTCLTVECSRCLEPYEKHTTTEFKDELRVVYSENGKEEAMLMSGEDVLEENLLITGDNIDLNEYFRQIFVISRNLKPLCKNSCRGICSICGANRNAVKCSCKNDTFDLRWAALKELKNTLNENNRRN